MFYWIRWSGVGLFVGFSALLLLIWWLALPGAIKWGIESSGEKVFGAKVNVEDVSLVFQPLALVVKGVSVADKDKPMQNLFSIQQARAETQWKALFLSKILVSDLKLSGVQTGGPRRSSGALDTRSKPASSGKQAENQQAEPDSGLSAPEMPSFEELLEREPLQTVILGKAFEGEYKQARAQIDAAKSSLPDKAALKSYEKELKQIFEGKIKNLEDFQQRQSRLKEIKQELKVHQQNIEQSYEQISKNGKELKRLYQALQDAPEKDLAILKSKYGFSSEGAVNLMGLLSGGDTALWLKKIYSYYLMIDEYLSEDGASVSDKEEAEKVEEVAVREQGRYVHFASDNPLPDVWIKHLAMEYLGDAQHPSSFQVDITVQDISSPMSVLGKPIRFSATGKQNTTSEDGLIQIEADGTIDRREGGAHDDMTLTMSNWPIDTIHMNDNLSLTSARLQLASMASVRNDQLSLDADLDIDKAAFDSVEASGLSRIQEELLAVVKGIKSFQIDLGAQGELSSPNLSLKSDLDKQLKAAFKERVDQSIGELESKLKGKLSDEVKRYAGDYSQYADSLIADESSLSGQSNDLQAMLDRKLDDYEDQLKEKAKEKAKSALEEKLKKLF